MATLKEKKRPSIRVRVRAAPDTQQRRGGGLRGCEQRRRYVPAGNWLAPTERCSCPRRVALPGDRSPERWGLHPCGVPAPTAPRAPFGLVFPPLAPPGSNVCSHSRRPASLAPAVQLLSCQGGEAATAPASALSAGSTLGGCGGRTGCPGQGAVPRGQPQGPPSVRRAPSASPPLGHVPGRLQEPRVVVLLQDVLRLVDEDRRALEALPAVGDLLGQLPQLHHLRGEQRHAKGLSSQHVA